MKFIDIVYASPALAAAASQSVGTNGGTVSGETATVVGHNGAAEESVLASLGINPSLFAFQLINFLIVAAIIWFKILKPLTNKMTERQQLIDESLKNAEKVQEKLLKSEKEYQEKIDQGKVDAAKIIEASHAEAQRVGEQMKQKAGREIELLIDQAKRNLAIEKDEMLFAVKQEAATLITAALEKILQEKFTTEQDKKMIAAMVKKMNYEEKK